MIHVIISSSSPSALPRTLIIKGNANNGNLPSCPFLVIAFINEEFTSCINEEAICP